MFDEYRELAVTVAGQALHEKKRAKEHRL